MLSQYGHFSNTALPDRIALLFIYMLLIRDVIAQFVNIWNAHKIRKQADHVLAGQPNVLYYQLDRDPEMPDIGCSEPIDEDRWKALQSVFESDSA